MRILPVISAVILSVSIAGAQHPHSHNHEEENGHIHDQTCGHDHTSGHRQHYHVHSRNEVGLNVGALYGLDDKVWGTGIHIHFFRTFTRQSRWSWGGFAEYALLDDEHYSLGAGVKFEPLHRLEVGVFPGIIISKHSREHNGHNHGEGWNTRFSAHLEVVYDLIHWKNIHMGPAFDYSWSRYDSHIMLGVHAALSF